jgi:hypothetical protein
MFESETATEEKKETFTTLHYEWTRDGERPHPKTQHCFTTYKFRAVPSDDNGNPALEVVDYLDSTPFRIVTPQRTGGGKKKARNTKTRCDQSQHCPATIANCRKSTPGPDLLQSIIK